MSSRIDEIKQEMRLIRKARQDELSRRILKIVKFGLPILAILFVIGLLIPESESDKQARDAATWEALWADVPDGPTKTDYINMKAEERAKSAD